MALNLAPGNPSQMSKTADLENYCLKKLRIQTQEEGSTNKEAGLVANT